MRADRLFYRVDQQGKRHAEPDPDKANLVGSRLPNGQHSPVLDLDYEARLVPSTTPGHFHLYLDGLEMESDTYESLLDDLASAGVIQRGFAGQMDRHGQTFLRPPGVLKFNGDGLDADSEKPTAPDRATCSVRHDTRERTTMLEKHGNVLTWASDIEPATLAQASVVAGMPFVQGHVALMPDAHIGKGATIGSVIPTRGAIIPAAVGVDIGCGMIAVETTLAAADLPDDLTPVLHGIEEHVPAGVGKGHEPGSRPASFGTFFGPPPLTPPLLAQVTSRQHATLRSQFGSLGSGNHFVEVCLDEREKVWIVLHSGSRGIGNQLASAHIEAAKGLMARYFIDLPDPDLAYLVEGSPEFDAYIAAMLWAQDYAAANRTEMMRAVLGVLSGHTRKFREVSRVNCHHNFTQRENHHGRNVWLTRKGAIQARAGDKGVIPGSMGTRSYIVEGLGNPASYDSCSHGAGRRMSRGNARRTLTADSLTAAMGDRTWNAAKAETLVDEHPSAYKDIDQVMADQADLVRVTHTLRQVLNYKGT